MTGWTGKRVLRLGAALAVVALVAAGCGDDDDDDDVSSDTGAADTAAPGDTGAADTGGGEGGGDLQIALLLPESATARYESQDRPIFEETVAANCPECEVLYNNANQDAAQQQSQAEAALTQGADVLVLDPVDGEAASVIVEQANEAGVPVISYDRLILNAPVDYYISFDNEQVGVLQAESLLGRMEEDGNADGTIVMINGSPTDNNATLFKAGAHSVFDESGLTIGAEYDTPDWSPDQAQQEMEQAITSLGPDGFWTIAIVTATGVSRIDGTSMEPLFTDPLIRSAAGSSPRARAMARLAAASASWRSAL